MALGNLLRLADLLDAGQYREQAQKLAKGFSQRLTKIPFSLPKMVGAYRGVEKPSAQVNFQLKLFLINL